MKITYSHHLSEIVFETILTVFHRKATFIRFLKSMHIKDSVLTEFSHYNTKREFLEYLFPKLQNSVNGQHAIVKMALELCKMNEFPDLNGFEDLKKNKLKAKEFVKVLREFIEQESNRIKNQDEINKKKEENRKRVEKEKLNRVTLSSLEQRLCDLSKHIGSQEAGYKFEKWFFDLVDFFEIQNRRPYKIKSGRQIDGSISINGTDYIIELKFKQKQIDVEDLDSIEVKLKSTADNTMAICVSMSGFSNNVIKNMEKGRTMVLLLDFNHINIILRGILNFSEMIERIKRHAAQTGESYLDPKTIY